MKTYKIDATSLSSSGCLLAFYNRIVRGLQPKGELGRDMQYGSAFHHFLEQYDRTQDLTQATFEGIKYLKANPGEEASTTEFLNTSHLTTSCQTYFDKVFAKGEDPLGRGELVMDSNGEPLVEQNFAIPVYHDSGIEILLCGTIDRIFKLSYGAHVVVDYKTTRQWDKEKYFRPYALSHQLITYAYVLRWLGQNMPDSIYSHMIDGRIGAAIIGIFLAKNKPIEIKASNVHFYTDDMFEDYEEVLQSLCSALVTYIAMNEVPPREGLVNGACRGAFNKLCPYFNLCVAPDNITRLALEKRDYEVKAYNPLMFRK